uniref:Cyclin-like domain-containing protein n=1 Tax=Oryza rufipogon TaxID=4529 RepID=A0A0E0PCN9_ORYRU
MDRASENRRLAAAGKPVPGIGEMGNRRPLRDINNLVGAPPHPSAIAKKPMLEKSGKEEQKPALVVSHRPMTRNFAASLTRKEQLDHQVSVADAAVVCTDPQKNPIPDGTVDDDVESCESNDYIAVDECNDTDEDESMMDIDSADSGNPLAATEYVEELYKFYRENEEMSCVQPDYMSSQGDINEKMRAILIDWLIEVHHKFELMDETLFLTVNIVDRFLEKQVVPRKKLQLVGVTAMLLACKYEEVAVPVVEDLVLISDRAYTKGQILEMEKLILNTLQFNMSVPTPYVFMRRFLKAAQSDKQFSQHNVLSLVASSGQRPANYIVDIPESSFYFHQKAGAGKLTGVHRKYSTFKFGCAAKTEPALFLLESGAGGYNLQKQPC